MMLLLAIGLLWLACRVVANGFVYPQSKRLSGFGHFGMRAAVIGGLQPCRVFVGLMSSVPSSFNATSSALERY